MGISTLPVTPNPFGFRNKIRNGDFSIWQRGNPTFGSGASTWGSHTADGWIFNKQDTTAGSWFSRGLLVLGGEGKWAGMCQVANQTGSGDFVMLEQRIEGVHTLQGKQVTLSVRLAASAGTPFVGVSTRQFFGTGGSPSTVVNQNIGKWTISTTEQRYTLTFTVPSIAGKTLGTNGDDSLGIRIWFSSGATQSAFAGFSAHQNTLFSINQVQLEEGRAATPFEILPWSLQEQWNYRYFQVFKSSDGNQPTLTQPNTSVASYYGSIPWKAQPRLLINTTTEAAIVTIGTLSGTSGCFYYRRNTATLIHKPNIRWDTQSSMLLAAEQAGFSITLAPSTADVNCPGIFPFGYDFAYASELIT